MSSLPVTSSQQLIIRNSPQQLKNFTTVSNFDGSVARESAFEALLGPGSIPGLGKTKDFKIGIHSIPA